MQITLLSLLVSGYLAQAPSLSHHEALSIASTEANTAEISCYGLLELEPEVGASYANPFNPEEIDVHAAFSHESGAEDRVNGFYAQSFERHSENENESIIPTGKAGWRIRFTPPLAGRWQYQVQVTDRTGSESSPVYPLTVTPSSH
ncbi:MAG TPA: DUF5060 domain-containing protein, partial [Candidatus Hydrogenedentes bacterium]|nr:DUF5060 domain-containing protein [Candidatus Hydrogenedentota bacterium]